VWPKSDDIGIFQYSAEIRSGQAETVVFIEEAIIGIRTNEDRTILRLGYHDLPGTITTEV
jgi:hypothetical protein